MISSKSKKIEQEIARLKEALTLKEQELQELKDKSIDHDTRFFALANATFEAIFISENGYCIETNQAASDMFGYTYDELIGIFGTDVIAPESKELVKMNMMSGYEYPYKAIGVRKDGSKFVGEYHARMFHYNGRNLRATVVRDIDEKENLEEKLTSLNEVFINLGIDFQQNLDSLVRNTFQLIGGACSLYYKLDTERTNLMVSSQYNCPDNLPQVDKAEGHICFEITIKENKDWVCIRDIDETKFTETDSNVRNYDLKSYLGYPVQVNGKAIGALCVVDTKKRNFTENDKRIIASLAKTISMEESRRHSEIALQETEVTYSNLIEKANINLIIISNNTIIYTNPTCSKQTGYPPEEMVGKAFSEFIHEEDQTMVFNYMEERLRNNKAPDTYDVRVLYKNGKYHNLEASITSVRYQNKTAQLVVLRDITEQKQVERTLRLAKEKAEQTDKLKSAFLANMSHEIRTPLNSIMGFSQLLRTKRMVEEKQQKYLRVIHEKGQELTGLIDDIIDISKLEANLLVLSEEKTNINHLFDELQKKYDRYKQSVRFVNLKMLTDDLANIQCDTKRLKQIIDILVHNAFKFTDEGQIQMSYFFNESKDQLDINNSNNSPYILFKVCDTGIGIANTHKKIIFERFRQTKKAEKKVKGGTGLGLSICKALCELMGGNIWVENNLPKGSCFYFTIPNTKVEPNSTPMEETRTIQQKDQLTPKKKLLLVEDNINNAILIEEILEDYDFEVIHVESGEEAIKQIDNSFHLVLLDIRLPGIDGFSTLKKIRAKFSELQIIALTAFNMREEVEQIQEAGFTDYISKPIDIEKFTSKIEYYLN